jgi:hypothetical protein
VKQLQQLSVVTLSDVHATMCWCRPHRRSATTVCASVASL